MSGQPHRSEESSAAPWLSPGLVRSDEVLLRTILDPDHLDSSGRLAIAAISLADIRHRGWSVERRQFTTLTRVKSFQAKWKNRKPSVRRFYVILLRAGEIRQPDSITSAQDFVIVDAAVWRNPGHAAVLLSRDLPESAARRLRNELLKRLPAHIDVHKAFDGADSFGYLNGMLRQISAFVMSACRLVLSSIRSVFN